MGTSLSLISTSFGKGVAMDKAELTKELKTVCAAWKDLDEKLITLRACMLIYWDETAPVATRNAAEERIAKLIGGVK